MIFDAHSSEEYVHRIGRTGRAGKRGIAITYMSSSDARMAPDLVKLLKDAAQEVPEGLNEMVTSGGSNACFKCGETGHMSRECPNSAGGGGGSQTCYKASAG